MTIAKDEQVIVIKYWIAGQEQDDPATPDLVDISPLQPLKENYSMTWTF